YLGNGTWQSNEQQQGFADRVESAGHTALSCVLDSGKTDQLIREIGDRLEAFPKPVAVMTWLDYVARFTASVASDLGLRLPRDLAIIGVNNNRWNSLMAEEEISSIQFDEYRLGYTAAVTLDRVMRGDDVEPVQRIPPLRVVARRSTDMVFSEDPIVADALQYVHDHTSEGISVEDVLVEVQCSRSTLDRRMKAAVGCTAREAIIRSRVEKAKQMLTTTDANTESIAWHCGFEHPPRLFEAFKRVTGMTPGTYRQSMRHTEMSEGSRFAGGGQTA
ncbi:MAG: helix-turn-helix domain-containing protein, partial [Phycisphaeraceae bacterium]|nr:helix-turn-helix domain-containing protein [Phycisphaeraceae bacterium]